MNLPCPLLTPGSWLLTSCIFLLTSYSLLLIPSHLQAQSTIPLNTWRLHLSYNTINSIATADQLIFGASESGILVLDREDNSIATYNTLNGLSGTGITHIAYDAARKQLLIAYADGNLDIIRDNTVRNFNRLKTSQLITGSKTIHHIAILGDLAYLSADFGVVVFDLKLLELRETWRDLDATGKVLKIFESTFYNDSIFLATEKGVMAGNLNANLLDFNNWKRTDTGDFAIAATSVTRFNNKVYAALTNRGVYRYDNGKWQRETVITGTSFGPLSASASNLLIIADNSLWKLSASGMLTPVTATPISAPLTAVADVQGNLWIGDRQNGLLIDVTGTFVSVLPNGPTFSEAFRMKYLSGKLFILGGGFDAASNPRNNNGVFNIFSDGQWQSTASTGDLTDAALLNNELYLSSFGYGVERTDNAGIKTVFNETNSPLQKTGTAPASVYVTDIEASDANLWVANYGASQSLHVFSNNAWQSFAFPFSAARYPLTLTIDMSGNVWAALDPAQGGGVLFFDPNDNRSSYKTEAIGAGALPSRAVRTIVTDREGYVWVGTDQGIAYFFSPNADAVKPIFENRFLLRDEKITSIAVDGGNRKWIGTERGVWLFDGAGEKLIYNFTTANSPLLSDRIRHIEINDETGEVFFATDNGIVSYRADATVGAPAFQDLKIFPNPVTARFSGTVGITGLATDAIVKITDISGKLIWQTQASGGTATWNVRDYNGRRAATGVYLVFAATEDGAERVVGKIAVITEE
ncbi:T9SS type A sorting domain-containing protein [Fulvivirgaceae bacterium PWU4]|uniref:T9SS type A sorting domain-containing protein n=1 Tax=Chryseosolibacter histidini TaxID=2782349 RepID=A0AAP2GKR5_9BACT|nr:two-component regulator propeller domain-containing protein [Chryseosolibacter histidini]MBT1699591.1 T9SS type A sorting domain-containing protein [Chryseosolibacter histidini]